MPAIAAAEVSAASIATASAARNAQAWTEENQPEKFSGGRRFAAELSRASYLIKRPREFSPPTPSIGGVPADGAARPAGGYRLLRA